MKRHNYKILQKAEREILSAKKLLKREKFLTIFIVYYKIAPKTKIPKLS